MKFLAIFAAVVAIAIQSEARPGLLPYHDHIYYQLPSASAQTTVVRDILGNQGTAYAYHNQDGISSSSVAVSRSDNSKTLAYVPYAAAAPVVYAPHHYQPSIVASGVPVPAVGYSGYGSYVV